MDVPFKGAGISWTCDKSFSWSVLPQLNMAATSIRRTEEKRQQMPLPQHSNVAPGSVTDSSILATGWTTGKIATCWTSPAKTQRLPPVHGSGVASQERKGSEDYTDVFYWKASPSRSKEEGRNSWKERKKRKRKKKEMSCDALREPG